MSSKSASLESASHEGQVILTPLGPSASFEARKRMFALTLENAAYTNWEQIHRYMCSRMKPIYALVCKHDGPNFPHIHCLYQYKNDKKISGDRLFGAHIETKVWSPQKYQAYCKGLDEKHIELGVKSETLIEEGELRKAGGARTIGDVKKMSRDEIDELPVQLHNIAEKIVEKQIIEDEWEQIIQDVWDDKLEKTKFIYVHGTPGNGKTYGAIKWCKGKYDPKDIGRCTIIDGFFHFIKPHAKVMIVPEFKDDCCKPSQFLTFTDKYGDQTNIKGGDVWTNFDVLIVCSAVLPQNLWPNTKDVNRWELIRRIDEFYEVDENHEWHKCIWNPDWNNWDKV